MNASTRMLEVEVCANEPLAPAISQLILQPPDALPFSPGQYVEVVIDSEVRPYSLCQPPRRDHRIAICVRHDESDFARQLVGQSPGETLLINGPRGAFHPFSRCAGSLLLVATGTGVAPFHAMTPELETLLAAGRDVVLLLGARRRDELLYEQTWRDLAERYARFRYLPTLSRAAQVPPWQGEVGRVQEALALALAGLPPGQVDAYLCGHWDMVRQLPGWLAELGVSEERTHTQQ